MMPGVKTPIRTIAVLSALLVGLTLPGADTTSQGTELTAAAGQSAAVDLELASVIAYGHSYLTWPSPRTYLARLQHRHGWDLTNAGYPGEQCKDTAARVIGSNSPTHWTPGSRQFVLLDCAANDISAHGTTGLTGYRNALRAIIGYTSLEGVLESSTATLSAGMSVSTNSEWSGGSMVYGRGTATLWAADRPGPWWIGYYGISSTTNGGTFKVYADPGNRLLATVPVGGQAQPSPGRSWTAAAIKVTLDTPASTFRVVKDDTLEGAYLDWWGHVNEDPRPRIVLPMQPHLSASGKIRFPLMTDATVDAYNAVLQAVATECGPHCVVVDNRPGWDPETMLLEDGIHPNDAGHRHLADAIDAALNG
jgi:hypothetical protein